MRSMRRACARHTRLPGVSRPFDASTVAATLVLSACASHRSYRAYLPRLCSALGVSRPLDASFRDCPPALFRAGIVHGLRSFEGFSPPVAPEASRLAVSSVSLPRLRAAGFEDLGIGWMRVAASRD